MGKLASAVLLAIATVTGALAPANGQSTLPNIPPPPTIIDRGTPITPLGWFVMGSIGCAVVSPMIGTVILGRELTLNEAYRSTPGVLPRTDRLAIGGCSGAAHGHNSNPDPDPDPDVEAAASAAAHRPRAQFQDTAAGRNTICGQRTRPRVCARRKRADAQYAREHSAIDRTGNAEIRTDRPHAQPLAH